METENLNMPHKNKSMKKITGKPDNRLSPKKVYLLLTPQCFHWFLPIRC